MLMRSISIYLLSLLIVLSSCLKEDVAVDPHQAGDMETVQIEIGYPYLNQVYYDCGSNTVVSTNSRYIWDLSFECSPTGDHILVNTAKGIFVSNEGAVPFSSVTSVSNAVWKWDAPSGNLDSTAIGDWQGTGDVYIIDRQFDASGTHLGYKKMQVQSVDANSFVFKFADLNGDNEYTYTIQKDDSRNFVHFAFDNGGQTLLLEPEKNSWDLLFTNHYHKFDNLPLPFVLTQVLTNKHNGVVVAEDRNYNFFTIHLGDTANYNFTSYWNEIGYDWKIRNSIDNSFTIDDSKSYLLKATDGFYFKLRFIDFYNSTGSKGYPKFEIQKL